MPTSHPNQLNEIIQIAELIDAKSILDIGIGFGKYGFLLREYLDLCKFNNYNKFNITIDGIEGSNIYITEIQKLIYDNIMMGDIRENVKNLSGTYELAILIDVIEHFTYHEGIEIIEYIFKKCETILITTPWDIGDINIRHENPLENHKFQWKKKIF